MRESLRDLANIEYGASPKEIRSNDTTNIGIFGTGGCVGYSTKPLFKGPLVVVARKGTLDNPLYIKDDCWIIDTAFAVLPKNNNDAKWLYYNLSYFDLKKLNESTGVPSISRDYLYRVSFEKFSIPEQQKIARILSSVDAVIEKTEVTIKKYKAIKQGMMQNLFTRGLDKSGKLRPCYKDAPELYKETILGWLPMEWNVAVLGDAEYFNLATGGTPSTAINDYWGGDIRWMSSGEVNKKRVYEVDGRITQEGLMHSNATFYPVNTVVIGLAGQGKTRATVAITYIETTSNQSIAGIICSKKYNPFMLYHLLDFQYEKLRSVSAGAGRAGLSLSILAKYPVIAPLKPEQDRIAKYIESLDNTINSNHLEMNKYLKLKQALMPNLLTGCVPVKVEEKSETVNV